MIADFTKLHDEIHKRARTIGISLTRCSDKQIGNRDVGTKTSIEHSLTGRKIAREVYFNLYTQRSESGNMLLGRKSDLFTQFVLNVLLDSSQHERFQYHVKSSDLVLVQVTFSLGFSASMSLNVFGKPLAKLVVRVKQGWHDEVKQGPQFCETKLATARD